jgi:hypothetical protein
MTRMQGVCASLCKEMTMKNKPQILCIEFLIKFSHAMWCIVGVETTLPRIEEQLSRSLYYNIKDLPLWHFKVWRCSNSIFTGAQYVTPDSKIYCEKVRLCQFSSGNWFFSAPDSCTLPWQVNGATQLCTSKKECSELDLTATQYF